MCLTNYGASEAVNLCVIGTWRNPPNVREKTVVFASSFQPSHDYII